MKPSKKTVLTLSALVLIVYLFMYYWEKIEGFLIKLSSAFAPVVLGFAVAYVLNILMNFYERHYFPHHASNVVVSKTRRPVCLCSAILTLIVILALVIMLVVPELVQCVRLLIAQVPPVIEKLLETNFVHNILPENVMDTLLAVNWQEHIVNIADVVTNGIGNAAVAIFTAITSVLSVTLTIFLSIIFAIYLLISKEKLIYQMKKISEHYIPQKYTKRIEHMLSVANDSFHRYIVGQCTEAIILGVLCMFGMVVLGLPYAGMIGTLIGLTALIPIAGAYIGAGAGALMILSVSPMKALLFLVFIVVLQQLEGNIIYPKVVGKSIGLPAIYVLVAITVGGGILGITGMLLGVPVASVIYRLVKEDISKKEGREYKE